MRRVRLVLVSAMVLGCGATELKSAWKNPEAAPVQFQAGRVAAVVVTTNEGLRRIAEDALVRTLAQRGLPTVPSYTIVEKMAAPTDPGRIVAQLKTAGIEAAVVMRVINRRVKVDYEPPTSSFYDKFVDVIAVETTLYSVADGRLIWVGVSETTDPSDIQSLVREVGEKAMAQLKKARLLV